MANANPLKDKTGKIIGYQIRVYKGRDAKGKQLKPYSMVWHIPEGMTNPRTIKKELEKVKAQFENDCKAGLVAPEKQSFQQYAKSFMALKVRDRKHRTVFRYEELFERINPEIGYLKMANIKPEHINRLCLKLAEEGQNKQTGGCLSAKTIREHYNLVHAVFAQAVKEGVVRFNPADAATPPSCKKKEAEFLEIEDVEKIQKCLEKEPLKWRCIVELFIATGARRGEVLGLKWKNIDFKHHSIKIVNNLQYTRDRGTYLDTTKTDEARTISVDPSVLALLQKHRNEQTLIRFRLGEAWHDEGFVFTQKDGKPMNPNSVTDYLGKFCKKYDLPHVHPHTFRHTHISALISNGVDVVTVAKRAGHKQVSTTEDIYAHVLAQADVRAGDIISEVFYKKNTKQA